MPFNQFKNVIVLVNALSQLEHEHFIILCDWNFLALHEASHARHMYKSTIVLDRSNFVRILFDLLLFRQHFAVPKCI